MVKQCSFAGKQPFPGSARREKEMRAQCSPRAEIMDLLLVYSMFGHITLRFRGRHTDHKQCVCQYEFGYKLVD